MRERLVFEIADRLLNHGVLAMLSLNDTEFFHAVGEDMKCSHVGSSCP